MPASVSVIMPTFNRARWVGNAIRSALQQMTAERILRTIDFGLMMSIAYPLHRDEREAVAAYLGKPGHLSGPPASAYCGAGRKPMDGDSTGNWNGWSATSTNTRFQTAEQAGLNDALVARLDESAAAELLESARWYLKRGDAVSARYVLSRLVEKFPSTAAGALGLQVMTQRGWIEESKMSPAPPEPPEKAAPQPKPPAADSPATGPPPGVPSVPPKPAKGGSP